MSSGPIELTDVAGVVRFKGTSKPAPGGGSMPVQVAVPKPADYDWDTPWLPVVLSNNTSPYFLNDVDWLGFVNVPTAVEATGVCFKEEVSTVGSKVRLAIYVADAAFQPSELLWQSDEIDLAVINGGDYAAATHTIPFVAPITFLGPYIFAVNYSGPVASDYPEGLNVGAQPIITTESGYQFFSQAQRPRAYGAFPDPGDPWLLADCSLQGADPSKIGEGGHPVPFGLSFA